METEIEVRETEKIITSQRLSNGNTVEVKSKTGRKSDNSCFVIRLPLFF